MNMDDDVYLTEEEEAAEALSEAQALREEIYAFAKQDAEASGQTDKAPPETKKKKKALSYQTAFRLMTGLVLLLLVFFIGMRWIEHSADRKIAFYAGDTEATLEAGNTPDAGERSIVQSVIDINTASEAELTALPGIGEVKAKLIVEYRSEYGRFTDVRELMNINGIGEATLQKLLPYITVEADPTAR